MSVHIYDKGLWTVSFILHKFLSVGQHTSNLKMLMLSSLENVNFAKLYPLDSFLLLDHLFLLIAAYLTFTNMTPRIMGLWAYV